MMEFCIFMGKSMTTIFCEHLTSGLLIPEALLSQVGHGKHFLNLLTEKW